MYPTLPAIPAIPDQRSQASVCRSNAISYVLAQECRETVAILESRSPVSVGRGEAPQPLQVRIDFPAGLVATDDGTAANGFTQRGIRRFGLSRRTAHRVHEAAAGDGQAGAF